MNKKPKNKILIFAVLLLLVLTINVLSYSKFVSAETVCAAKTKSGAFCQTGTCINENSGICSSNTAKSVCEDEGGKWSSKTVGEIAECKPSCCIIGSSVAFVSETECANLATDYGVDINFRSDINDEASCLTLSSSEDKGACVVSSSGTDRCTQESKSDCGIKNGAFYEGLLCTAPGLSDCAKSGDKTCLNDDIYFKDTCGNVANIYDEKMDPTISSDTKEMNDYWTDIKTDYSDVSYSGDCDYNSGTSCGVTAGKYSCESLACDGVKINGGVETKQHGESWCMESPGTVPHILVDSQTAEFIDPKQREDIEDGVSKYNIPGSRYYRANCWEGEVIIEPCADYRTEVCKESKIGENKDFSVAKCITNGWRLCSEIKDKSSCDESYIDCKWVPGYRYDGVNLGGEGEDNPEEVRQDEQGSCVPLYAPGFDFWKSDSTASAVCELGSVTSTAFYETSWTKNRGEIKKKLSVASSDCVENCDAIPGYESGVGKSFAKGLNVDKENIIRELFDKKGIFKTNADWLWSLTARGKSLGDCGYKLGVNGEKSGGSSEVITALFQKLSQKEGVKSSYKKKNPVLIYARDDWTGNDKRTVGTGEDYTDIEDDVLQNKTGSN